MSHDEAGIVPQDYMTTNHEHRYIESASNVTNWISNLIVSSVGGPEISQLVWAVRVRRSARGFLSKHVRDRQWVLVGGCRRGGLEVEGTGVWWVVCAVPSKWTPSPQLEAQRTATWGD